MNPRTYEYGLCRAEKGKCPFGEENHYATMREAEEAAEMKHREDWENASDSMNLGGSMKPHWDRELFEHYNAAVSVYDDYDESAIDTTGAKMLSMWRDDKQLTEEKLAANPNNPVLKERLDILNTFISVHDRNLAGRHRNFKNYGETLHDYGQMLAMIDKPDISKGMSRQEKDRISEKAFQTNRQYIHDEMFPNEYEWDDADADGNCQHWVEYMNDDVAIIGVHSCWDPDEIQEMVDNGEINNDDVPEQSTWYFFANPKTGEMIHRDDWTMMDYPDGGPEKSFKQIITENLDDTRKNLDMISTSNTLHNARLIPYGGTLNGLKKHPEKP